MKAAVCYEFGKPLVIEDIGIDPPRAGEVKVRLAARVIRHGLRAAVVALSSFAMALVAFAGSFQGAAAEAESPWAVVCADANDARTCRMQQTLFADQTVKGQQKRLGQLLALTVLYVGEEARRPLLVMKLPLGVDLRPGMVLRVDKYEEIKAPYLRCTNAGCEVQVELTAELVAQLKGGLKLRVGFRPFGSSKTVVIDASLKGFTRAFDRLM